MRRPVFSALVSGVALALAVWATSFGTSVAAAQNKRTPVLAPSTTWGAYLSALHASRHKDAGRASAYFVVVTPLAPSREVLLVRALQAHVLAGRLLRAVDIAKQIVTLAPGHSMSRLVLGLEAARQKNFTEARSHLDRMPNDNVNRLLLPLLRAWAVLGLHNDPDLALNEHADLQAQRQFRLFRLMHTAFILDVAGKQQRAAKAYEDMAKALPFASLRLTETAANFKARAGSRDGALKDIDRYLSSNPSSMTMTALRLSLGEGKDITPLIGSPADGMAEVLLNVASALSEAGRASQALPFIQLAVWLRPRDSASRFLLGVVMENDSRYHEAIATFRSLETQSIYSWEARKSIVASMVSLENYDEAIAILEKMAKEEPKRFDTLWLLGNVYRNQSKFAKAAEAYDRAVARIPQITRRHWNLLYVRGIALERSKQWARAEADFLRALKLNPGQAYVLNYLAYSWVDRGKNLQRSRKMLAEAVKKRPNDGYIVDSVGWVEYRLGNFTEAVRHLERATELRPHDPTINDHLGDAYWRAGREHEARFQWRRALSLKPEDDAKPLIEKKLKEGMAPFKPIVRQKP